MAMYPSDANPAGYHGTLTFESTKRDSPSSSAPTPFDPQSRYSEASSSFTLDVTSHRARQNSISDQRKLMADSLHSWGSRPQSNSMYPHEAGRIPGYELHDVGSQKVDLAAKNHKIDDLSSINSSRRFSTPSAKPSRHRNFWPTLPLRLRFRPSGVVRPPKSNSFGNKKAKFSNERTMVHWIKAAMLLGNIALTLQSFGENNITPYIGVALLVICLMTLIYASTTFQVRMEWLNMQRDDVIYYDRFAPTVLTICLMLTFGFNAIVSYKGNFDRSKDFLKMQGIATPIMVKRYASEILSTKDQGLLSQSLTLPFSGRVIKNRFCKSALSESLARSDGQMDKVHMDRFVQVYDAWARGGSGMIITGNIMVDRTMREMAHNVAVEDERDIGRLSVWAQTVQKHGAAIYAQVNHPGRQTHANLTKVPVAPSAIPVSNFHPLMSFNPPRALTTAEVEDLVRSFVKTCVVLHKAGFDGVELHAAHGYLISQFLNPRTNERTDDYGGSLKNRFRFLAEIVQGIKKATPSEFSIGVKLNSVDFGRRRKADTGASPATAGVDEDLEEAVEIAMLLEDLGVDFIEISGGSYESFAAGLLDRKDVPPTTSNSLSSLASSDSNKTMTERTQKREAHFAVFAERISKALATTVVILTGGFVSATAMADSLKTTTTTTADFVTGRDNGTPHIDMVGLGRSMCTEPDLPNRIMSGEVTGAIKLPKTPGGFFDDVFICGGNIRRMAFGKKPLWSISRMLVSPEHLVYAMDYAKVAMQTIKGIFV
ncbi:hypothetical protein BGZ99_009046 [Dissophora globulifera]|uniref:NADH:flavin oxidoreductase/NADH oxidase N-terminal domain-containing protein n=1 Tax=Dissophora globulifera TaxID=979702 RepID=A0A9P6RUX4_9FUNG|nr:hypothetical protein BGZ99_009046 [Dissophora globulifera]